MLWSHTHTRMPTQTKNKEKSVRRHFVDLIKSVERALGLKNVFYVCVNTHTHIRLSIFTATVVTVSGELRPYAVAATTLPNAPAPRILPAHKQVLK